MQAQQNVCVHVHGSLIHNIPKEKTHSLSRNEWTNMACLYHGILKSHKRKECLMKLQHGRTCVNTLHLRSEWQRTRIVWFQWREMAMRLIQRQQQVRQGGSMTGRRHGVSLRFRTIWETAITLGGIVALTISVDVLELRICKWTGFSSGIFRMGPCCTYFKLWLPELWKSKSLWL